MPTFNLPDYFSGHIPSFERHLSHLKGAGCSAIEIGSAEGRSAIWLLENILTHESSWLGCIDPWEWKPEAEDNFDRNTEAFGKKVIKKKAHSNRVLPVMWMHTYRMDFIYIDGNHQAKHVLEDAVLAWPLLKSGGIMAFDDYNWSDFEDCPNGLLPGEVGVPPKPAIDAFLLCYQNELEVLECESQVWIRKR